MRRLNDKIYLLCKIRRFVNSYTALSIFKSHVMSYLEYGSIFFDCIPISQKNKLERLQNKCLRVCHLTDRHTSNSMLHKRSNALPLRLRRKMSICSLMYRRIQKDRSLLHVSGRIGNRSQGSYMVKTPLPKRESFKRSNENSRYNNINANRYWFCLMNYLLELREGISRERSSSRYWD